MPKAFSRRTLGEFEDASASIVLRQIDRAFNAVGLLVGEDPGGLGGDRRTQFRRYVAGADQHDPQQLKQLGAALGALIAEVAASKKDFLLQAAERDGFFFEDGIFRPAETVPISFAVTRVEDLALIDERGRRLHLLASDSPSDAARGAKELVESVCRTVLRLSGEPAGAGTLVDVARSTLEALEPAVGGEDAKMGTLVRKCLEQLSAVVAESGEVRKRHGALRGRDNKWKELSPPYARLAVGAAVTFARFVAETYAERAASEIRLTV